MLKRTAVMAGLLWLLAAGPAVPGATPEELQQQVMETEREFAATMAERDFAAFKSYLDDETVFFAGDKPLVGKQAVADAWQEFYAGEAAPFSWQPEQVVVLESGTLALSTGPVFNPDGQRVATFTSIWRLQAPGVWRIVFDKGCNCQGG